MLNQDDADGAVVRAEMPRQFPGCEGLVGFYLVEDKYVANPVAAPSTAHDPHVPSAAF